MIKDIDSPKVTDIAIAVINELNEDGEKIWNTYIINLKDENIEGVLVSSNGYGIKDELKVKTSTLRHHLKEVKSKSFKLIEPIMEDVFCLNNEYWISFFIDSKMYDKKFVFLAETIKEENFTTVPIINKKGVMIK